MKKTKIVSFYLDITDLPTVIDSIFNRLANRKPGYVCVANVHMCMEAFDNPGYQKIIDNAAMTVPDGRPLVWTQKLLGHRNAGQVRGSDLMLNVCREAEKKKMPVGLCGGSVTALRGFQKFLGDRYPNLDIACAISPPFRKLTENEDETYVRQINESGVRILFVGLGCPKQEYWMAEHKDKVNCVMIGIGAAFDFFGGTQKEAPGVMQKTGTEWIFRFMSEPWRLWKRYLKHNPRFVYYFLKQLSSNK